MLQLLGVVVDFLVAHVRDDVATEQVDRHALDRGDVDERVARLRVRQIGLGQDFGIELLVLFEVLRLEPLV